MDSVISYVRRIIPPTETDFYIPSTWVYDGSVIDLDFANDRYWNSPNFPADTTSLLSISRASNGYAKTVSGTLTQFGNDTLRRTDLGLLIEGSKTNIVLYSQAMSNWYNLLGLASNLDNQAVAPDGTTTANKIVEDAATAPHTTHQWTTGTAEPYVFSAYVKAGPTRRYAALNITVSGTSGNGAVFDLQDGLVTYATQFGTGLGKSSSIEAMGNGWYRCSVQLDLDAAADQSRYYIGLSDSATPVWNNSVEATPSYAGDGSSYIFAWGAQLELLGPLSSPSSYIPTSGTSAARAQDVVTAIGALDSNIAAATGSILVNVIINSVISGANYMDLVSDQANTNLMLRAIGDTSFDSYQSSTILAASLGGSVTFSGGAKVAASRDGSGRTIVGGGGTAASDANHAGISGATIGSGVFYPCFGYFRRLTAWNTRLSDSVLRAVTVP